MAKDYRPISLCNLCYNVIPKIIVNRLKPVLPQLISFEQSAFVSDRAIMDNVLIAQEGLHSMRYRNAGKKLMAIKVDMERAYDMMQWDFLRVVMGKFGFSDQFVASVMGCITDPNFAVLVSESPTSWFQSNVGLRQGDPLSPYLFIIGAEVLTRMIKCEQNNGMLSGLSL